MIEVTIRWAIDGNSPASVMYIAQQMNLAIKFVCWVYDGFCYSPHSVKYLVHEDDVPLFLLRFN